jgi:hypothetical protein
MFTPELLGFTPSVIVTPSNWTTAIISLQISIDGGATWCNFHPWTASDYNTHGTVLANQAHFMNDYPLRGISLFRIRSGTGASPVNQTTDSILTIICTTN